MADYVGPAYMDVLNTMRDIRKSLQTMKHNLKDGEVFDAAITVEAQAISALALTLVKQA